MKKTVFKGVINGQNFDNVNDYNARMRELIESGASIDAASSTHTQEVCEKCEKDECDCGTNDSCSELEGFNYLPGFESDANYLDVLVTDNPDLDTVTLNNLREQLASLYATISNAIPKMSHHDLTEYGSDIEDVFTVLNQNQESADKASGSLHKKMDDLQTKLDKLERATYFTNEYVAFYNNIFAKVKERLNQLNPPAPKKDINANGSALSKVLEVMRQYGLI